MTTEAVRRFNAAVERADRLTGFRADRGTVGDLLMRLIMDGRIQTAEELVVAISWVEMEKTLSRR